MTRLEEAPPPAPRSRRTPRRLLVAAAAVALALPTGALAALPARALAAPSPGAYGEHDFGGFRNSVYCGRGKLGKCRQALLDSLTDALAHDSNAELYPDGSCELGRAGYSAAPQMCLDRIVFTAVGAITQPDMPWINRPTFQQAVEVQGHR